MFVRAMPFIAVTLVLALPLATVSAAAPFVPPAEASVPFRRDKLPIDTDSMALLSRLMEHLAQGASLQDAAQRRAAAQALALSLALDPGNTKARSVLSAIAEGRGGALHAEKITSAKVRVWQFYSWLASPGAGVDGNLFADLMGDAAAALDPSHPTAVGLRAFGERGKWAGWVEPLSSFEEIKPLPAENLLEKPSDTSPPESSAQPTQFALSEASVKTILYVYDEVKDASGFGHTVARMEALVDEGRAEKSSKEGGVFDSGLRLEIPSWKGSERNVREFIANPILLALDEAGVQHPKHGRITLSAGDGGNYSFRRNTNALSGAGFLLAHAALTGSVPDATVIGVLDSKGQLAPPPHLWFYVNMLRDGRGGRLVIPAAAEEHFLALLTFGEPDFFLKYEVLTASTPKEFAEFSAPPSIENEGSISSRFEEIRDKAPTISLEPYLTNRFVRQRLLDIHTEMPQHLSAKMLALQGSAQRPPRTLSRGVLASVIWHAVAPVNDVLEVEILDLDATRTTAMEKAYEEARAALDRLDRHAARADTDLLTRAKSMTSDLRALTRSLRSRSGDFDARYSAISRGFDTARKSNGILRKDLSEITGDPFREDALERVQKQRARLRSR